MPENSEIQEVSCSIQAHDESDGEGSDYVGEDASDSDADSDTSDDDYDVLSDTASTRDQPGTTLDPEECSENDGVPARRLVSRWSLVQNRGKCERGIAGGLIARLGRRVLRLHLY